MIIYYIIINKIHAFMTALYQLLKNQLKTVKTTKVNNNIVLNLLMSHCQNYFNKIKTMILDKISV